MAGDVRVSYSWKWVIYTVTHAASHGWGVSINITGTDDNSIISAHAHTPDMASVSSHKLSVDDE